MAKIAVELEQAIARRAAEGSAGKTMPRLVASGDGWSVADVVCTSGPQDRPFEERHTRYSVAIVLAGTFQYRSRAGSGLMTPGSLMLGNAGHPYECGHEHAHGDRCVAFSFAPDYLERLAADAGAGPADAPFRAPRLPPVGTLARLVAAAAAGIGGDARVSWEELGVRLAARAVQLSAGVTRIGSGVPAGALARVTRAVRLIERHPDARLTLGTLARAAGLSPYYFLRTFERLTGVTPHQYVRRARLRDAAVRLAAAPDRVLDIALDCGFGDISTFNRAFRTEFGVTPRGYRAPRS